VLEKSVYNKGKTKQEEQWKITHKLKDRKRKQTREWIMENRVKSPSQQTIGVLLDDHFQYFPSQKQ